MVRLLAVAALCLWGCKKARVPADIVYGCQGGLTGAGAYQRITPEGTIKSCGSVTYKDPAACAIVRDDRVMFDRLDAAMDEVKFETMPEGAPTNHYCTLSRGEKTVFITSTEIEESLAPVLKHWKK